MSTYIVTQDGARFEVRLDNANGQVIATFSNKLAAEAFAERQRAIAQGAAETARGRASLTATKRPPRPRESVWRGSGGWSDVRPDR